MRSQPKQSPSDASSDKMCNSNSNTSKLVGVMSMKDLPSESCKEKNNYVVPTKQPLQLYCSDLTPSAIDTFKPKKDLSSLERELEKKKNSIEKYLVAKAFKIAFLPESFESKLLKTPAKNVAKIKENFERESQNKSADTSDVPINLVTRKSLSCSPKHVERKEVSMPQAASTSPLNTNKIFKAVDVVQPAASRDSREACKQFSKVYPKQFENKFANLQQGIQLQTQQQLLQLHQSRQKLLYQQNSSKQSLDQPRSSLENSSVLNPPPYTQAAIEQIRNAAFQLEMSKSPNDPKITNNFVKKSAVKQSFSANQIGYKHPKSTYKTRSNSHVSSRQGSSRKMQPVSELLARLRGVSKDDIARMNAVPNAGKRARRVHNIVHIPVSNFVYEYFYSIQIFKSCEVSFE